MKFKKVLVLFILVVASACVEKVIAEPENLIPKNKMAQIYYDLAIVTAAKNTNNTILKNNNIQGMDYIFTKYEIDSVQFVQSDLYYASNPSVYKEIYESTEKMIKADVKVLEDAKEAKRKQDSIERVKAPKKLDSLKVAKKVLD